MTYAQRRQTIREVNYMQRAAAQKQVDEEKTQITFVFAIIVAISIGLGQNSASEYPCEKGFHARSWITGMLICYCIDFVLIGFNIYNLKTKYVQNICVFLLRFLLLIAIVVQLIIGNVNYYPKSDMTTDCGSLKTYALVVIIIGYFEMLKCCCLGMLGCCLIPVIILSARNQRPDSNWQPAQEGFIQNLYKTRFSPQAGANQEQVQCAICLEEFIE